VGLSPPYCRDQLSLIAMRLLSILGSLSKPSGSASAFVSQAAALQASLPPTPRGLQCTALGTASRLPLWSPEVAIRALG
jgi:hypothetical protein